MAKNIITAFLLFFIGSIYSQTLVDLEGVNNTKLKKHIEQNTAKLFDRINLAYKQKSDHIDFSGIDMSDDAKVNIDALWGTSPFLIQELEIYEKLLVKETNSGKISGYELRNIHIYIKEADKNERNKQAVITFTPTGKINDFYISIDYKLYDKVMVEGKSMKDVRLRQIILDFIENFRTAYNRKDLKFIEQVFSDDALIIVGKQVKVKKLDGTGTQYVTKYIVRNKKQYIQRLKSAFNANEYVNVRFEDIKVVRHGTLQHMYGVTVKQFWKSDHYSDEGFVFLLIDLRNENKPMIHVRTWDKKDSFNIRSFRLDDF